MNKQDLINQVAHQAGLSKANAEKALNATIKTISKTLSKGGQVRLVGFGTFTTARRAATKGRNPRTGVPIQIPATRYPKFRAGKALKTSVAPH